MSAPTPKFPEGTVAIVQSWQRHVTVYGLLVVITVLIGWDVYAAWGGVHGDTISEVTMSTLWPHPSLAAGLGYLMGHLTWSNNMNKTTKRTRTIILCIVGAILITLDFGFHLLPVMPPILPFTLFVLLGHLFWPQILEE